MCLSHPKHINSSQCFEKTFQPPEINPRIGRSFAQKYRENHTELSHQNSFPTGSDLASLRLLREAGGLGTAGEPFSDEADDAVMEKLQAD